MLSLLKTEEINLLIKIYEYTLMFQLPFLPRLRLAEVRQGQLAFPVLTMVLIFIKFSALAL